MCKSGFQSAEAKAKSSALCLTFVTSSTSLSLSRINRGNKDAILRAILIAMMLVRLV
jgi:hypothetical protein